MTDLLIRDVVCFTPIQRIEGDVLIEDGRVTEIGRVTGSSDNVVHGRKRWLWPGAIDGHVHFRDPGPTHKEDWTTGSTAAVAGGVTTVLEMPNTSPTTTTVKRLEEKRALASAKSLCNFGLFFGASTTNLDEVLEVRNIAALKIFMGCSTGDLLVYEEEDLARIFEACPHRIAVHAESELRLQERAKLFEDRSDPAVHSEIRDPETAAEAVRLACRLALANQRRLHILHLSTRLELDAVLAARELGMENGAAHRSITSEVCPHHLFMNTDAYERYGTRVRMNPPLRGEDDRQAMWDGLCRGKVDIIATDHAPHSIEDKTRPYRQAPSGVPGVQTMLPLMLDAAFRGLCTPEQVLQWLCHGPADVWGIRERGRLEVGNPADLVLIDPLMIRKVSDAEQFSKCRWTPWAERTLTGWPVLTLVGGQVAYRRDDSEPGQVVGEAGLGNEVEFSA